MIPKERAFHAGKAKGEEEGNQERSLEQRGTLENLNFFFTVMWKNIQSMISLPLMQIMHLIEVTEFWGYRR